MIDFLMIQTYTYKKQATGNDTHPTHNKAIDFEKYDTRIALLSDQMKEITNMLRQLALQVASQ